MTELRSNTRKIKTWVTQNWKYPFKKKKIESDILVSLDLTVQNLLYKPFSLCLLFLFSTLSSIFCFNLICQTDLTRVSSQTLPKTSVSHRAGWENLCVVVIRCFQLRGECDLITEGSTPGLNSVGFWKQYLYGREIYRRRIQEKFTRGSCKPRPTPFPPVISSLRENLCKVSALCVCC